MRATITIEERRTGSSMATEHGRTMSEPGMGGGWGMMTTTKIGVEMVERIEHIQAGADGRTAETERVCGLGIGKRTEAGENGQRRDTGWEATTDARLDEGKGLDHAREAARTTPTSTGNGSRMENETVLTLPLVQTVVPLHTRRTTLI
jgi:hypothetical protein